MTNFIQAVSRHAPFAFSDLSRAAFQGHREAAQRDSAQREEAEYQTVFALTAALLIGGVAVALSGLAQAL